MLTLTIDSTQWTTCCHSMESTILILPKIRSAGRQTGGEQCNEQCARSDQRTSCDERDDQMDEDL